MKPIIIWNYQIRKIEYFLTFNYLNHTKIIFKNPKFQIPKRKKITTKEQKPIISFPKKFLQSSIEQFILIIFNPN